MLLMGKIMDTDLIERNKVKSLGTAKPSQLVGAKEIHCPSRNCY